jgi:signal transduction histidine kinase
MWVLYRRRIIAFLAVCTLQTILIVAMLIERSSRKRAESSLRASKRLLQSAIDAMPSPIALVGGNGKVVAVNESWSGFGEPSPFIGSDKGVGCNYFEICESVAQSEDTQQVCDAVRDLISGKRDQFWGVYHCGRGIGRLHFQVRMNRFYTDEMPWVVMAHEDVTEIKQAHDAHKQLTALLLRAQDDERRRIARDLHDVTVQNVVAIKTDLNRIQKLSQHVDSNINEKLKESVGLSDQVIHELRTLSYLLHPPLLDELGLIPALQWFIRGFNERSEIQLNLVIKGDIARLPGDVETALFRVTQESIANIHRHSGSSDGTVTVTFERYTAIVQIADHGRGFSGRWRDRVDGTFAPGVGIMGMRQRLEQLGGHLDIESNRQGTTVTARIVFRKEGYATNFDRRRPRRSAPVHS